MQPTLKSPKYDEGYELDPILDLELTVLSSAVWSKKDLALVMEELSEDDFTLPTSREVFRSIRDMFVAGEEVDKLTLKGRIPVTSWFSLTPPTTFNLPAYIKRVQEAGQVKRLRELGTKLQEAEGDSARLAAILDEQLATLVRRDSYHGATLQEALATAMVERQNGAIASTAVDYPWSHINRSTRGLRAGWLCYLAGRPGCGKTAAAIELAVSAAKQGKRVLFNSLEMDQSEIAVRVAQRFGLDSEAFYMGSMDDGDWKALREAAAYDMLRNIRLEYAPTIAKLTAMVRSYRPELIIVDYVQLMEHASVERVEGTTQTSHSLKRLARKYRTPVVALSQLNRAPKDQSKSAPPDMSDLRDSGALEQDADQIIFVWREMDRQHNIPTPKGLFIAAKARMGQPGKQLFHFDGARQQFLMVDAHG